MSVPKDYVRSPNEQYFLFSYMLRQKPDMIPSLRQACISGLESVKYTTPIESMKKKIELQLAA